MLRFRQGQRLEGSEVASDRPVVRRDLLGDLRLGRRLVADKHGIGGRAGLVAESHLDGSQMLDRDRPLTVDLGRLVVHDPETDDGRGGDGDRGNEQNTGHAQELGAEGESHGRPRAAGSGCAWHSAHRNEHRLVRFTSGIGWPPPGAESSNVTRCPPTPAIDATTERLRANRACRPRPG